MILAGGGFIGLELAENLPEEDPKLDAMMEIIERKQKEPKNKVMIFSSFKHTLRYLNQKLIEKGKYYYKNKLDEKYSILWLFASFVILVVSIFPNIITIVANKFSVYYPPTLMLLFAIIILGAYIIHISMVITKQNKMIVKLTQELGILKKEIENDKEK